MLRAITLWQPHASLIALRHKLYETRSWFTHHRGDLAIHASKKRDRPILSDIRHIHDLLDTYGVDDEIDDLPFGAIVAVVRVVECHRDMPRPPGLAGHLGIFGDGRVAWELADVRALERPVPCVGAQGLWRVPGDVESRVREQIMGSRDA
jgi:hypothetical protein